MTALTSIKETLSEPVVLTERQSSPGGGEKEEEEDVWRCDANIK